MMAAALSERQGAFQPERAANAGARDVGDPGPQQDRTRAARPFAALEAIAANDGLVDPAEAAAGRDHQLAGANGAGQPKHPQQRQPRNPRTANGAHSKKV